MGKYYITENTSDFVDSLIYYTNEDAELDHFGAGGNRYLSNYGKEWYNTIYDSLISSMDEINALFEDPEAADSAVDLVSHVLDIIKEDFKKADGTALKNSELLAVYKLQKDFASTLTDSPEEQLIIRQACEIFFDEPFEYDTLTGYSQSDGVCAIYPKALSDKIPFIEAALFSTGTEYFLCLDKLDQPPSEEAGQGELDIMTDYTELSQNDTVGLKKWAASIIGCLPDEVEIITY